MTTMTATELKAELKQFTGTEFWYRHPFYKKFTYTDGVRFLAKEAGAYWLIDMIFAFQHEDQVKAEPFQCWKLEVKENKGTLTCEDGNYNKVFTHALSFTDFPLDEAELWFTGDVLLLPSEY